MKNPVSSRRGSALLLALVTIVVLSSLLVSFLYRIHIEEELATQARFGFKALHLARGGQDYAKWLLLSSTRADASGEEMLDEALVQAKDRLKDGLPLLGFPIPEVEEGSCTVSIRPESSWRNVNQLPDADWEQLLDDTGVPTDYHAQLIDAFRDWTDADDQTRLQGAEEDDPYYEDRSIPVKNAPVTVLSELGLIKGFTPAVLYGGTLEFFYDRPEVEVSGIAPRLTVYGEDRIHLNSASAPVLMTLSGIRAEQVEALIEGRLGEDGLPGTEDDGFANVAQALGTAGIASDLDGRFSTSDFSWVRIQSVGRVGEVVRVVEAVYQINGQEFILHSYEEFRP
jgi:type II secretory pathway component PulK